MSDRDKALLSALKAIFAVCEEVVYYSDIRMIRAGQALKDLEKAMQLETRFTDAVAGESCKITIS